LKPKIAITMGDPAGVGPELCLLALRNPDLTKICVPLVFGDPGVLEKVAGRARLEPPSHVMSAEEWSRSHSWIETPAVVSAGNMELEPLTAGEVNAGTGRASFGYVEAAIAAVQRGEVNAIATAPIHKEALRSAGIDFPGHTEILGARLGANRICMMLTSEAITCSFVTTHVGYAEVPSLLTTERILDVIEMTAEAMRRLRGRAPVLAVCGLNPHAGEHGLFGHGEEERCIAPALELARGKGISVEGPLPADTAFLEQRRKKTDAFVCMYHDQGLIPVKSLAFEEAVNVTLGLPVVRTSVDHGTALDIAWKGLADPGSLFQAVRLAARLISEEADPRAGGC
jgi:4-phospho-D-threonate 3-dehydrogenase / 4-phospho-D-erythronate 3-dehydrogenase